MKCQVVDCHLEAAEAYHTPTGDHVVHLCIKHRPKGSAMTKRVKSWTKREKEVLGKLGLRSHPGSGNGEMFPEDGSSERLIAQMKSTTGETARINRVDYKDLSRHAEVAHRAPLFVLDLVDGPLLICFEPAYLEEVYKHFKQKGLLDNDGDTWNPESLREWGEYLSSRASNGDSECS